MSTVSGETPMSAVVFPGISLSNHAAVGRFMARDPLVARRLAEVRRVLGYQLLERFAEAGREYGETSQLAFFVNCLALADRAEAHMGMRADFCSGPSFGQLAAACYTGALPFSEGIALVSRIARCEEAYFAEHHRDLVTHFFFRTPEEGLHAILRKMEHRGEWYDMSSYLGDGFFGITLSSDLVEDFGARVRAVGGVPLYSLFPAVHCSAFGGLRERVARILDRTPIEPPRIPLVSDQDGGMITTADGVRALITDGYVRPVKWRSAVDALAGAGVGKVWVPGPASVFDRLARTRFDVVSVPPEEDPPGPVPAGASALPRATPDRHEPRPLPRVRVKD